MAYAKSYFNLEWDMTENKIIPFWLKLNMTVKEASAYSGIGEKTLRNMLSQRGCSFIFKVGNKNMVKRKEFEKYLDTVANLKK